MSDTPVATLSWPARLGRLLVLVLLAGVALQLYFLLRIALMTVIDPASTTFQRSEIWRLATTQGSVDWAQEWRDYEELGQPIARAVIASEDAGFVEHSGVEWDAIEKAWERNQRAEAVAERRNEQLERRQQQALARGRAPAEPPPRVEPKVVGGSTITQQLAKNLFLSPSRSYLRKAEEAIITVMIEALWDKRRILEVYLNVVEWGNGIFGCEAAAQRYYRVPAAQLAPAQAARLAVMLPNPRKYEKTYGPRLAAHAARIQARMQYSEVP